MGWATEVTGESLSKEQYSFVKKWCVQNDHEYDGISGSLEGVLEGYNAYSTNSWQTGCVPLLELNRFFLYNKDKKSLLPLTAPLVRDSDITLKRFRGADLSIPLKVRYNKLLVYYEESKGTTAVWTYTSKSEPLAKNFTILYSKFSLGDESFYFVSGLEYKAKPLERAYDLEDLVGKASYSKLL